MKLANNNLEKAMNLYIEEHTYAIIDDVRYFSQGELAKSLDITVVTLKKYIDSEGSIEAAVLTLKFKEKYKDLDNLFEKNNKKNLIQVNSNLPKIIKKESVMKKVANFIKRVLLKRE